jgi:broad specificity phosphatase PhoE
MSGRTFTIPGPMLDSIARAPRDRAVAILLRHSVRDHLPPDDVGYTMPLTDAGRQLARELGAVLGDRLASLHTSPVVRCVETAESLREGAAATVPVLVDRALGDPGAFVVDGRRAWVNWKELGHPAMVDHLARGATPLPGLANPAAAARYLVRHMLGATNGRPGLHVFVTHDILVTATAARLLDIPLEKPEWPRFVEGALFWRDGEATCVEYRDHRGRAADPACQLDEEAVIDLARREAAATIGLDADARYFVVGGAFKALLTGCRAADLDVWAASDGDRVRLVDALLARGATPLEPRPFSDAFAIADRTVDVARSTVAPRLEDRLARFDLALSAVGAEHAPHDRWSAFVHPRAVESVRRREVLLLEPLVNWKYALTTVERMRRYARELGYSTAPEEEAKAWRVFREQADVRAGMLARFERTGRGGFGVAEEVACAPR